MSVNEKMTAIADAIRGKTGKAEKLTLDQMPLEISSIVSGGGGDDSYNNPWVSYETAEIGIGENNVTNVEEAIEFMKSASGLDVVDDFVILNNPTTYNQLVSKVYGRMVETQQAGYRYRDGAISQISMSSAFDAVLVQGTRYLVRKMIVDTSNVSPY